METVIGLLPNDKEICLLTKSFSVPKVEQLVLTEWPPNKAAEGTSLSGVGHPKASRYRALPPKNAVTVASTALKQFALCGLGGIGKTEIAREFARRHKDSFDAVFWVVADDIAKLDHHYQQISLALGLEDLSECKSQVVSREIVKGWLSNPRKHVSRSDDSVQPGEDS
ncbi:unnamed protein product [Penicillium camemberti]|uniref:Str. FM013 n=1 Tax=Penicillium camemberti (strain FM 013) TaxID=1429867 RepID=A0A0G4PMS1_PENC3|nr:unnamed protein product [Penicillium camemberti]